MKSFVEFVLLGCVSICMAGVMFVSCTTGCTHQQQDMAEKVLTMSAKACVAVAQAKGRTDIATACGLTEDAVEILSKSLDDQTCELPAAGVQ